MWATTGPWGATARTASRAGQPWLWSTCGRKAEPEGLGTSLMAIVAEGNRRRIYLPANEAHRHAADVEQPEESAPEASIPPQAPSFRVQAYGMNSVGGPFHEPSAPGVDDIQRSRDGGPRTCTP